MRLYKYDPHGVINEFQVICWVILEIDGRILLIQHGREGYYAHWGLPYAHLRRNEKLVNTLKRALKSTTGLTAEPAYFIGIVRAKGDPRELHLAFLMKNPKGKIKIKGEKVLIANTFDFHQIQRMPDESLVHKEIKDILKRYRQGYHFPLDLVYEVVG